MSQHRVIAVCMRLDPDLAGRLEALGTLRFTDELAGRADKLAISADADGLLVYGPTTLVDAEFIASCPRLQAISTASVGYDHIDVAAAGARRIPVGHTPLVVNEAVVDLTMTLIVALARRLMENQRFAADGRWAAGERPPPLGHDIRGTTLGVVGYGRIGRDVARRMGGLGMRVIWNDVEGRAGDTADAEGFRSLEQLLGESDFVSLHTNWIPGAPPIIGAAELARMKPSAYLVNTGRGRLVDQAALVEALQEGVIAGAGLDVLADEPPDPADPIVSLPNVICLPHIGTATAETRRAMREMAVDNLVAILTGSEPPALVDPGVLDR